MAKSKHPSRSSLRGMAALSALTLAVAGFAQTRPIDAGQSSMTVRVFKAGILSAFGHNHEIAAPIAAGSVDIAGRSVELRIHSASLRVRDRGASEKDRQEIQGTMRGPEVLDVGRFPEIVFRSTAAEPLDAASWRVRGDLTLHGQTRAITVDVRQEGGRYVGVSRFKQTAFGIKPVKVAGGAVRVKDEVQVEFDIRLAQ